MAPSSLVNKIPAYIEPTLGSREEQYRQAFLAADKQMFIGGLLALAIVSLAFVYNDYLFFGLAPQFRHLLVMRCGLAAIVMVFIRVSGRLEKPSRYDCAALGLALCVVAADIYVATTRPPWYGVMTGEPFIVLTLYLIVPGNLVLRAFPAFLLSGGYILVAFLYRITLPVPVKYLLILSMIVANALGILISVRLNNARRKHFSTEMTLRDSEDLYRQMFERNPAITLLIDPQTGEIVYANPAASEFYGYTEDQLRQLKIGDIGGLCDEGGCDPAADVLSGQSTYSLLRHRLASGEMRDVELYSGPVDVQGRRLVYSIIHDITDRKKAEEEIRRAKEEWETTFDTVPDLIMIVDTEYRIVRANKATLERLGLPPEKVVGERCFRPFHNMDKAPPVCPYSQLLSDGLSHEAEVHEPLLGRTFAVSANPVFDQEGRLTGAVHVARDITQRKHAEDQIKGSLKDKEVLLREIQHRVKNNFQMMEGLLILQADQAPDPGQKAVLKEAEARVHAMARVHERLYQSDHVGDIRMDEYLTELAEDLISFHGWSGGRIALRINMEPITLDIDSAIACGLILTELISNSLKHAFPKGASGFVDIGLHALPDNAFELMVRDDGKGFSESFSLEESTSLGLRLVRAFAERFRGEIALERDHGTTVRIRLERDEGAAAYRTGPHPEKTP